jgi:ABC-type phosphate transport system substrate-binding protein
MRMFKITALAALAIVGGCAKIRGSANGDSVTTTVGQSRAQALDIARTQLVHHGFTVTGAGSDVLVTSPKTVPEYLREASTAKPTAQKWFLVVQGSDVRFFRGTRLRVTGYVLPPGAGQASSVANGTRLQQSAIPITEQNPRLFREVQVAANWIIAESNRKK